MLAITEVNREQIEREFLALVMNKNEVIDLLQIKPKILKNANNRKLLSQAVECYKTRKVVLPNLMMELYKDFDIDYYMQILNDEMWYPSAWREQLETAQESILKFYKEDVIKALNEKLKSKQIDYTEFITNLKKLDDIQLAENITELTKKEILESINEEKARINLNKFPKLNNTLKMVQGDFLIIGATTGAGKSGLLLNLMVDLMTGFQCVYFNMEMSKSTIYKRILSITSDLRISDVEKPQTDHQRGLIEKALEKIEKAELIIEHKATDMSAIKSTIAKIKNKDKHTIVFIDHLGLVRIEGMKSLYEQATEVAKQLRQICLEYDCTIISASQLNRGAYSSDEITLSMLKDSGELENSASKVMLLYKSQNAKREDVIQEMIFDVAKNRDGFTGHISAMYNKEKQVFKEKEEY